MSIAQWYQVKQGDRLQHATTKRIVTVMCAHGSSVCALGNAGSESVYRNMRSRWMFVPRANG